jgi:rhomboid protease GluP
MNDPVELRLCGSLEDADQLALVLTAVGISSRLVAHPHGVGLYVAHDDATAARSELQAFREENVPPPRQPGPPQDAGARAYDAFVTWAAIVAFLFGATHRGAFAVNWIGLGALEADRLLAGEWWRSVTALGLHVELDHLLGNLAFGCLFSVLLARPTGTGVAWLGMHSSIGASTAVFGAVGMLSGHAHGSPADPRRAGVRRWAAIGAGVMLLAFLGFEGERTDIGAHVAGFAVGIPLGLLAARLGRDGRLGGPAQRLAGGAAALLFAVAWAAALAAG